MHEQGFLIAVHCDITEWYMTSVMDPNRSIYPFTPERLRFVRALLSPPPQELINSAAQHEYILGKKTEQEVSNQGNTVHAKLVISGSCLRNRGDVSNRDVPYRSSLRYNSMGPYTFPRDNTVAANYTHYTRFIEAFALIEVPTAAGGEHINRATFIIGGMDRDPAPVGNHPEMCNITCRHR